jgi:hypothetical protein
LRGIFFFSILGNLSTFVKYCTTSGGISQAMGIAVQRYLSKLVNSVPRFLFVRSCGLEVADQVRFCTLDGKQLRARGCSFSVTGRAFCLGSSLGAHRKTSVFLRSRRNRQDSDKYVNSPKNLNICLIQTGRTKFHYTVLRIVVRYNKISCK